MPTLLIDKPGKVATPTVTVTAEPPVRVPPLGLVPMARLMEVPLSPVWTLPLASSTATVTAGVIAEPAALLVGPCTKARWLAGDGVMLKVDDVAPVYAGVLAAVSV